MTVALVTSSGRSSRDWLTLHMQDHARSRPSPVRTEPRTETTVKGCVLVLFLFHCLLKKQISYKAVIMGRGNLEKGILEPPYAGWYKFLPDEYYKEDYFVINSRS